MKVITLAKTKELLGIADTSQDAAITAQIPIIDSKVKQITNNRYNDQITGDITSGSLYVPVYSFYCCGVSYVYRSGRVWCSGINNNYVIDDLEEYLQTGQLIEGDGIPAEAYIDEIYYNGGSVELGGDTFTVPVIKLSSAATATTAGNQMFIGITIGLQPTVAKGIQYLINQTSTSLPSNSLASRTIGPSSKSFAAKDQEIDNRYGMPAWFVKAFPQYQGGH